MANVFQTLTQRINDRLQRITPDIDLNEIGKEIPLPQESATEGTVQQTQPVQQQRQTPAQQSAAVDTGTVESTVSSALPKNLGTVQNIAESANETGRTAVPTDIRPEASPSAESSGYFIPPTQQAEAQNAESFEIPPEIFESIGPLPQVPTADNVRPREENEGNRSTEAEPRNVPEAPAVVDAEEIQKEEEETAEEAFLDREFSEAEVMNAGVVAKPVRSAVPNSLSSVFSEARDLFRSGIKSIFSNANRREGLAFNGVVYSSPSTPPHCISLPLDMVIDSIMDPDSGFLDLVNQKIEAAYGDEAFSLTAAECMVDPALLVDVINGTETIPSIELEVTVEKSPVNLRNSVQVRTLRVHYGGGIGLHPTQSKGFNADFDADQMVVNADQANLRHYQRSMDYLLDIEGNPNLDMDFFPVDSIDEDQAKDASFSLKAMFLNNRYFADNYRIVLSKESFDSISDRIFKAYLRLSNTDISNESAYNRAVINLLKTIDSIASEYSSVSGTSKNVLSSYLFKAVYDFACERRAISIETQVSDIVENDIFSELDESDITYPIVYDLINEVNDMVIYAMSSGVAPHNLVQFGEFFHRQYGSVAKRGSNITFRMVADFCKAVHRTDLITIGNPVYGIDMSGYSADDFVPFEDVYKITCAVAETKILANRISTGSGELAASTQVRARVLKHLQKNFNGRIFPDYSQAETIEQRNQMFRVWLQEFAEAYTLYTRMLSASQVSIRNGMRISNRKVNPKFNDGINDVVEDIAKPLVEVFGDYYVSRIFPDNYTFSGPEMGRDLANKESIWIGFEDMPLRQFVMHNRLKWGSNGLPGKNEIKKHAGSGSISGSKLVPRDILMLVADRRTKQLGDFSKNWITATEKNVGLIAEVASHRGTADFNKYMSEVLEIFHLMSADMFVFFGIDSVETFAKSEHGRKLIEASSRNDVDAVRSELVSMMVEMRLHRSSKIISEKRALSKEIASCFDGSISEQVSALDALLENEYSKMSESSYVWGAIISDVQKGAENSTFRKLIKSKGVIGDVMPSREKWKSEASEFWADPDSEKYGSIITFLKSSAPYETKMKVLCDITRMNANYRDLKPSDMIGMLAYDPDSVSDNSSFDLDIGVKHALDRVKASVDKASSYRSKLPDQIAVEHSEFMEQIRSDRAGFERFLTRAANEPGFLYHVDQSLAGDAIGSVFEKNMHDSEKIQTQVQVKGYFENVSIQQTGGFFSHLQQTDNKVVNVVGSDQLTVMDLIMVLADPDVELYVYDQFGTMVRKPMTRATLCGGNSIDDVIDYLNDNPRISSLIRRRVGGVSASEGSNGSAISNRMKYESTVFDSTIDRVWGLLTDRPQFCAACALITPSADDVGRNISERASKTIDYMCSFVAEIAWDNRNISRDNGSGSDAAIDEMIDEKLGLSVSSIAEALRNDRVEGIELWDEDIEELEKDATDIYNLIHEELREAIEIVEQSSIDLDIEEIYDSMYSVEENYPLGLDHISVKACSDVLQQIGGSRTEKMLDIEGSETKKNEALKIWARGLTDRYGMDEEGNVVELSLTEPRQDQTLNTNRHRQLSAVSKFLEIKREKGAEKFIAKTRKFGNDGLNTIVKYLKFTDESMSRGKSLQRAIRETNDREEAVRILAEALIEEDEALGYKDIGTVFVLSDYYNRADVMIGTNSDGTFTIRTLEQLSAALRSRLTDDVLYAGEEADSFDEQERVARMQISALDAIADVIGTDRDPMYTKDTDVMYNALIGIPIPGVTAHPENIDRAMRARSSSFERTYELLNKIVFQMMSKAREANKDWKIPSRAEIQSRATSIWNSLDREYQKKLEGIGYPKGHYTDNGKWVQGTDWSKSYDLIGTSWAPIPMEMYVPGPQSLVLFKRDASENPRLFKRCEDLGITVAFLDAPYTADNYGRDIIYTGTKSNEGVWILPFFDMKLNGCFHDPVMPAPAVYKANSNNFITTVKTETAEFGPADAAFTATKELVDRVRFFFSSKKPEVFRPENLFAGTLNSKKYSRGLYKFEVEFCDDVTVQTKIVSEWKANRRISETIDYGVKEGNPKALERAKARFEMRMDAYAEKFDAYADSKSFLTEGDAVCDHDSIVGFVRMKITGPDGVQYVYAPIIPFPPERSGARPSKFKLVPPVIDNDTGSIAVNWQYAGSLRDQIIKIFEGIGASNKFMVGPDLAKSRTLANGRPIDGFYYHASVASRLFASNERLHTMISLMMVAKTDPQFAYNFAKLAGAFPNNPEVREKLLHNRMTLQDWKEARSSIEKFHSTDDPLGQVLDAFARNLVDKALAYGNVNPSLLLCSRTYDDFNSNEGALLELWMTEFDAFFDTSYAFEDAFLRFFHAMQPRLCPDGIMDIEGAKASLFKPELRKDSGNAFGTLLCLVPHYHTDGSEYKVPEVVFISPGFMGEEYSDFKSTNYNAKNRLMDSLNVASVLTPREQALMLMHACYRPSRSILGSGCITVSEDSVPKTKVGSEEFWDELMPGTNDLLDGIEYKVVDSKDLHKRVISGPEYGKVLTLTGHRPKDLWGYGDDTRYRIVYDQLLAYCKENNIDTIISGMAQGFDQIGAKVALDNGLKLICAVPFVGQESTWSEDDQAEYRSILEQADEVFLISQGGYSPKKMFDRNEWMIENGDSVYALYNPNAHDKDQKRGGTKAAIDYAESIGKPVFSSDPRLITDEDLSPKKDGKTHLNVYSNGKTDVGRFLSNFATLDIPITTRYGDFKTLEGLWHFLGIPLDTPGIEQLKTLDGARARRLGQELKRKYGRLDRPDFEDLIRASVHRKLLSNPDKWYGSPLLSLPLKHYFVKRNGGVEDHTEEYSWFLDIIQDEIKNCTEILDARKAQ